MKASSDFVITCYQVNGLLCFLIETSMTLRKDIIIKCRECDHILRVDEQWARKYLPRDLYASTDYKEWHLKQKKDKLKCAKCGAHSVEIKHEYTTIQQNTIQQNTELDSYEKRYIAADPIHKKPTVRQKRKLDSFPKRYIDEGIAGSREDNKKMGGRQWARNIKPKA